jgi:hypothetical protein
LLDREVISTTTGGYSEVQTLFFNYYVDIRRACVDAKKQLCSLVNAQTKFLSATDYKENALILVILESKVPRPRITTDYKVIEFKFPLDNVQPGDMCELHIKTSENMYRGVF